MINRFKFGILLISMAFTGFIVGQSETIIDRFESYTEMPREVVYVHLNKSTYIQGEMMGFKAYVFNKRTKSPSKMTTNLYCTISDNKGILLKKKLIKVDNGTSSNIFNIDSTLSTGVYTFKAYTNWMRNFEENNHFEQTFKVIDANEPGLIRPLAMNETKIDLQVLGEGGHLLYGIPNSVGIIAKNQLGYGVPNVMGRIIDGAGAVVAQFQLNDVGLTKSLFTPMFGESYAVEIDVDNTVHRSEISDIKSLGVILRLLPLKNEIKIILMTNEKTLKSMADDTLKVSLHNGKDIILNDVNLNPDGTAVVKFFKEDLHPGINIFSVFDGNNSPILERIYFNKETLMRKGLPKINVTQTHDSLNVKFQLSDYDPKKVSSISVSVMPTATKAYDHHNNIISQLYLRPYVKGYIESASRYFKNDSPKTEYELDVLMMTQGWSSYDWTSIFNHMGNYPNDFEQGITAIANINKNQTGHYLIHGLKNLDIQVIDVPEDVGRFELKNLFPIDKERLNITYSSKKKKGKLFELPNLYLQYFPNRFEEINKSHRTISERFISNDLLFLNASVSKEWEAGLAQQLDTVTLIGKKKLTKLEKLKQKAINNEIKIINEFEALNNKPIDQILRLLGWRAFFDPSTGQLSIRNPRERNFIVSQNRNILGVPMVYIDDLLLNFNPSDQSNFFVLMQYPMKYIEYIEYNFYGIGIRGQAGFIKIHTLDEPIYGSPPLTGKMSYDIPLSFSPEKQFYVPLYKHYDTPFYKEYGTIAWQPNLTLNDAGELSFMIADTGINRISLFIEGIFNEDYFVSEEMILERH